MGGESGSDDGRSAEPDETGNCEPSEWEPDRVADERDHGRSATEAGLHLAYKGVRDQRPVGKRTIYTEVPALQILSVWVKRVVATRL